jgi:hypothetical protein
VKNFTKFPCEGRNQPLNICADSKRAPFLRGDFFGF